MSHDNDILSKEVQKIYGTRVVEEIQNKEPIIEDNDGDEVNDIIASLQSDNKPKEQIEIMELKDENLDQFILNYAGQMVKDSVEYIKELRDHYQLNSTPDEIKAFGEAVKASAAAVESLNKMSMTRQKIKAAKELKEMDCKAKLSENNGDKITFTRDQLFNAIINNTKDREKTEKIREDAIDI